MLQVRSFVWVVACCALVFIFSPDHAHAADQVVTNCSSDIELRADLTAMQNTTGGTLTFNCGTATITLTGVLPTITKNTTINGGGVITLSGNNTSRILIINGGVTLNLNNITLTKGYNDGDGGAVYNGGTLNITNSKFLENLTSANGGSGGAIVSYGPLNITNSEFARNKAANGGAIYPRYNPAQVKITGGSIHHNETTSTNDGWGGAVLLWDGADVEINNTDIYANEAVKGGALHTQFVGSEIKMTGGKLRDNQSDTGGAIFSSNGIVRLKNVTVSGNDAKYGGGIHKTGGDLSIENSTFSNNEVAFSGGAIYTYAGNPSYLTNSTFSGNRAGQEGGAFFVSKASVYFTNTTLFGNGAPNGGAIHFYGTTVDTLFFKNSLIANSTQGGNCFQLQNTAVNISSGGFNLSTDSTCAPFFNQAGDRNNQNALLGALANNGGSTQTHLPQKGSPAINNATANAAPNTDQRGMPRPQGAAYDIGAVEACLAPAKPVPVKPKNGGKVKKPTVLLNWNDPLCAVRYKVIVRFDSQTGPKAFALKNLTTSQGETKTLIPGRTYVWQVTAIGPQGKTKSDWWSFRAK